MGKTDPDPDTNAYLFAVSESNQQSTVSLKRSYQCPLK